jgi:hypothetical protein
MLEGRAPAVVAMAKELRVALMVPCIMSSIAIVITITIPLKPNV